MTTAHGQTKMNDSLYALTQRLYGSHHTSKALWDNMQSIVDVNKQAYDCTNPFYNWPDITRRRDYATKALPPYTLYLLPPEVLDKQSTDHMQSVEGIDAVNFSQYINLSPMPYRRKLNTLIDDGHDLGALAVLLHLKEKFGSIEEDAALAAGVALETAMESSHYFTERLSDLKEAFEGLDTRLAQYKSAPSLKKHAVKKLLVDDLTDMNVKFNKVMKGISKRVSANKPSNYLKSPRQLRIAASKHPHFSLMRTPEARVLMRSIKYAKLIGKGLIAIRLGEAVHDVYEAYEHGEDWHLEALEQAAEITGASLSGIIVDVAVGAIVLTPAGWVAILASTAGALVGGIAAKTAISKKYKRMTS